MRYDVLTPGGTTPTAWKLVFCEQRALGSLAIWKEPFTCLRAPKYFNLRMDPYERADTGPTSNYHALETENPYLFIPGSGQLIPGFEQGVVGMKVGGERRLIIQ